MSRFGDRPKLDKLGLAVISLFGWLVLIGSTACLLTLFEIF